MVHFIAARDPDIERQAQLDARVRSILGSADGMALDGVVRGDLRVWWSIAATTPFDRFERADGAMALVWGTPRDPSSGRPVAAEELATAWLDSREGQLPHYAGYFAAIVAHDGQILAAVDVLGFFPLYFASNPDWTVVASSAHLASQHEAVPRRVDLRGLVGSLIWMGTVGGRTLIEDVRRLRPGDSLSWRHRQGALERAHYRIPSVTRRPLRSEADEVRAVHQLMSDALFRQVGDADSVGLMLSGGRDSRILAGLLSDRVDVRAVIIPNELDAGPARAVASRLDIQATEIAAPTELAVESARRQARWHQLEAGFYSAHLWGLVPGLGAVAPRMVAGFMFERMTTGWGLNPDGLHGRTDIFDKFVALANTVTVDVSALRRMSRPSTMDALEAAFDDLRADWSAESDDPNECVWRLEARYTDRAHVGLIPWRLAHGPWPILPVLDPQLIAWAAEAPLPLFANRNLQDRVLTDRFPALASIPHVNAGLEIADPLSPSLFQRARGLIRRPPRGMRRTPTGGLVPLKRPYRDEHMLFDGPGWRAIRRAAEPSREWLHEFFDPAPLAEYLPPPDRDLGTDGPEQMGRQALVGLMLWAQEAGL